MLGFFCGCDRKCVVLKQWIKKIDNKLEIIMGALENANAKLDVLDAVVTDLSGDVTALVALTAQLKDQVAAGQVDLELANQIEAKATALAGRLASVDAEVEAAVGGQVEPEPIPQPVEGEEDTPFFKPAGQR